jgi:hypothetical protein
MGEKFATDPPLSSVLKSNFSRSPQLLHRPADQQHPSPSLIQGGWAHSPKSLSSTKESVPSGLHEANTKWEAAAQQGCSVSNTTSLGEVAPAAGSRHHRRQASVGHGGEC